MKRTDCAIAAPAGGWRAGHAERGAALLIILLIGLIVGLSALFSSLGQQQTETSRAAQSGDLMVIAKNALVGYAASYHERETERVWGYLPCPDTNNDGVHNTSFADCPNNPSQTVIGRLPYQTLGLPDLRDHTGECLWYVVSASHNAMNTAPGMNWDLRGNLKIVDKDGRVLADPDDADGGAVAAIIAPGPPLAGQNRVAGNLRCSGDATNTFNNWLEGNTAYSSPAAGTVVLRQGEVGSPDHNDRIVWITARELYAPIARRSDLLGTMLEDLRTCFTSFANLPLPASAYQIANGAGDPKLTMLADGIDQVLGATSSTAACSWYSSTTSFSPNLWKHWKDHIRYVVCNDRTPCLNVTPSVGPCTGALLFAGRTMDGAPRTAAEKTVAGYFKGDNNTSLGGTDTTFSGAATYNPDNPAQDLALCLNPSTPPGGTPITLSGPVAIAAKTVADGTLAAIAGSTLTLGDPDVDSGDAAVESLSGCAWLNAEPAFGTGLRAYFRYVIVKKGEGFVFSILDADRNRSIATCGGGGRHLGYAGLLGNGLSNLRYPKIGIEIDTNSQTGPGDDPTSPISGKSDPASSHVAVVLWGQHAPADDSHSATTYTYDDNVHGAPTAPQPLPPSSYANPINPPATALVGVDQINAVRHVRLEVVRTYSAAVHSATYEIKVWLDLNAAPPADGAGTEFNDTTTDYQSPPLISTTFNIGDLFDGIEAFKNFRLGFTNGVSGTAQEIQITQFEARTR